MDGDELHPPQPESERLYLGMALYHIVCRHCDTVNTTRWHPNHYGETKWRRCIACGGITWYRIGLDPFTYTIKHP